MSSDGHVLDGDAIKRLVTEVADELAGPEQRTIVVVGGSLLAWHGLRKTTRDVDSIRPIDDDLRDGVRRVAERHGLTVDWLNDRSVAFAPVGFDVASCEVLFEHPRLRALGAPFRDVFLMKLRRGDPQDLIDMRVLWPYVQDRFATAADVVDAFFEAFPSEPDDEFLPLLVVDELAKDGVKMPLS
ncbi:hypothetical protein BH10ACT2_BH10ACT2_00750 [soil metagenome]